MHSRLLSISSPTGSIIEAALFEFWVVPNPKLESEILALGADAEVRAPASLRARLKATVAQMQKMYAQAT